MCASRLFHRKLLIRQTLDVIFSDRWGKLLWGDGGNC